MNKLLLSFAFMTVSAVFFGQFTTGTVTLGGSGMTIKIVTNSTTATLTLTGPDTSWLGIGFGGTSMSSVTDMFIWNDTADRDYLAPGGQMQPNADASQSWTITSDTVAAGVRTVIATRALVSSGDFTFVNSTASISIIYAVSDTTTLGQHNGEHSSRVLTRTALGVEDFSLNATAIFPNPSNGIFNIQTKTSLDKINVYSQTGVFVKTIEVIDGSNNIEINLKGLQSGVYLLELQNDTEKSWKKIVLE